MTYRVRPLKCGEVLAPGPAVYLLRDYEQWYPLSVYIWLIEGGGRRVLVDTGPGDLAEINAPREPHRRWHAEPILAVLERAGVRPEEIDTVVLSHLHHDHAGNVGLFREATVILAQREWEFVLNPPHPALAPHPLFPKQVIDYLGSLKSKRLCLVRSGHTVVPGIRISVLGAHTPGSLAVEVASAAGLGRVLIAGDVIFTYRNFKDMIPVGTLLNVFEWYAAWHQLAASRATVLPSHDPEIGLRWRDAR